VGPTYVNRSVQVIAEIASAVTTRTWTVPAACAGETAMIQVGETTQKKAAGVVPNRTSVTPMNWPPVMSTTVPPCVAPKGGKTCSTTGTTAASFTTCLRAGEVLVVKLPSPE